MNKRLSAYALVLVFFCGGSANSEERPAESGVLADPTLGNPDVLLIQIPDPPKKEVKDPVGPKKDEKKELPAPPDLNLFSSAPSDGGEAPMGRNPRMIGDFPGYFALRTIFVPSTQTINTFQTQTTFQTVTQNVPVTILVDTVVQTERGPIIVQTPTTIQVPVTTTSSRTSQVPLTFQVPINVKTVVAVPLVSSGAFKIAENESAHPEDRIFLTYNYFNGLHGPNGASTTRVDVQQGTLDGQPATFSTLIPGVRPPRVSVNREVFGFEKLILDGRTSIGLRVPLLQQQGDGSFGADGIGDLSAIFKHAFYLDPEGNVVSAGLVVTAPTGQAIETFAGRVHPTLIQPFAGYLYNSDRFYIQGFTSLAVPTDGRDTTVLFNDIAIGYSVYRGDPSKFFSFVTPTIEAHLTTPLNHTREVDPIIVPNILAMTAGTHVGIYGRSTLTLAMTAPITGPRPFNFEAIAQFNYNY